MAYRIRAFGSDCLGNISGYQVVDPHGNECGLFVGDIYKPGSFEQAEKQAQELVAKLELVAAS